MTSPTNDDALGPRLQKIETRLAQMQATIDARLGQMQAQIERRLAQLQHADTIYLGEHEALTRLHTGHRIYVDTRDVGICSHLMLEGRWEPWIETGLASAVKPGMRFCDVGANFGYYTLLGAQWVGEAGRVFSFEANPEILKKLRKSVLVNGFGNTVSLFGNAVYSDRRTLDLVFSFEFSGGGSTFGGDARSPWAAHRAEVEAAPLDDLLADVPDVQVMKIDVEGAEPHVIRGARRLIERSRTLTLVIEFHETSVAQVVSPRAYLESFVKDGFSIALLEPAGITDTLTAEACLTTLGGRLGYLFLTRTG